MIVIFGGGSLQEARHFSDSARAGYALSTPCLVNGQAIDK
jgi:hypothetical protein